LNAPRIWPGSRSPSIERERRGAVNGSWPARILIAVWAAAGAACSVIGASETLSDAQQVIAAMKIAPLELKEGDLRVTGAVDHADRVYRVGEPIALSVEVNRAAYVAVLRVMPNGATTLVFPNRRQPSAQVGPNAPPLAVVIAADKPGVALFEFVASARGDSWLFNRKPEAPAEFVELGSTTRELARDIVLSLKIGHGRDTAAAHLNVRVRGE
jgi:hypothetical protein